MLVLPIKLAVPDFTLQLNRCHEVLKWATQNSYETHESEKNRKIYYTKEKGLRQLDVTPCSVNYRKEDSNLHGINSH